MNIQRDITADDHIETGLAFHRENDFENAVLYYEKALRLNRQDGQLYFLLGTALSQLKNFKEAEYFLLKSLHENPANITTYQNLGRLYSETNNLPAAKSIYEKAIEIDPDCFDIYFDLIHIYLFFRLFDQALTYTKLLEANRYNLSKTYFLFSIIYDTLNQCQRAIHYCQLSLQLDQSQNWVRSQLAFMHMKLGKLIYMWNAFEIRHAVVPHDKIQRKFGGRWKGENFKNNSLVILGEQGLGDIIQFIRFAKQIKEKGGKVYYVGAPSLFKLLKNVEGIDACVDEKSNDFKCRYSVFVMSVFKPLKLSEKNLPSFSPYIKADNFFIQKWADRLSRDQFNIGIVWQGNREHGKDPFRSFHLSYFYPLSQVKNVRLISLQKHHGLEQLNECPADMNLTNWASEMDTEGDAFVDTAAIIHHLDLVITIDSAIAHLAGAMGRPVWTVLGFGSDWRWMTDTSETIWYPSMRLFRQHVGEEPEALFQRVADAAAQQVDLKFNETVPDTMMPKLNRA